MLRSREAFARLGAGGRVRSHPLIVVHYLPNALDHDRFGIATGRRLGSAVRRNLVRRRLRHALRTMPSAPGQGWDILVVARPATATASFGELSAALQGLLTSVRASVKAAP